MRTSNKLILAFVVLLFGFSLLVHGVLYHRYEKSEFVSEEQLRSEQFVEYHLPKPQVIVFDGAIWVNLISADSFVLALPRINKDPDAGMFENPAIVRLKVARADDKALTYEQRGDTLFVNGNTTIPIHRPFSDWFYRRNLPAVDVYAPSFDNIHINHGQVCLRGTKDMGGHPIHINILNSTLWIGMQYPSVRHDLPESFDSIDLSSSNSIIVMNSTARVNRLNALLKDSSVLTDQYSIIDSSSITVRADSRLDMSGDNLKRSRVTIH